MTAQKEHVRRQLGPTAQPGVPIAPAPAPCPTLAEELGQLERSEREVRDRLRQQELQRLREVARYD